MDKKPDSSTFINLILDVLQMEMPLSEDCKAMQRALYKGNLVIQGHCPHCDLSEVNRISVNSKLDSGVHYFLKKGTSETSF